MSRGRSASRRDYTNDRAWLLAFVEAAPRELDELDASRLAGADQFAIGFDVPTICDAATVFLAAADVRMERGSAAGRASVAAMVAAYRRTLAATPMAARLAEVAERALKVAENEGAESARDAKAALDDKRIDDRRTIVARLYWPARREADAAGRKVSLKHLLSNVRAALEAADLPGLSEATLRRDVEELLNQNG